MSVLVFFVVCPYQGEGKGKGYIGQRLLLFYTCERHAHAYMCVGFFARMLSGGRGGGREEGDKGGAVPASRGIPELNESNAQVGIKTAQ